MRQLQPVSTQVASTHPPARASGLASVGSTLGNGQMQVLIQKQQQDQDALSAKVEAALTLLTPADGDFESEVRWTLEHPYQTTEKDVNPEATAAALTGDPRDGEFLVDFNAEITAGLTGLNWRPGLTIYRPRVIPGDESKRSRLRNYQTEKSNIDRERALRAARERRFYRDDLRVNDAIGTGPVLVTKGGAFVLSSGAKKFLTDLLKEMYNGFWIDLDKITIRFVDTLHGYAGKYDAPADLADGGLIRLARDQWDKQLGRRTLQLMVLGHELVHAFQDYMYRLRAVSTPPRHDVAQEEHDNPQNYTLTQQLLHTDISKLDKRALGNTEDQLGQRLMYEIAKRLGDEREYTDHWKLEKEPPPALPGGP